MNINEILEKIDKTPDTETARKLEKPLKLVTEVGSDCIHISIVSLAGDGVASAVAVR